MSDELIETLIDEYSKVVGNRRTPEEWLINPNPNLKGVQAMIAEQFASMAITLRYLPTGPEHSAGMRKLIEARDCFVRASLPDEQLSSEEIDDAIKRGVGQ